MTERVVALPRRTLEFSPERQAAIDPSVEWIVTNGLGGYASAPVSGGLTRRYHGLLVAALPPPAGRIVYLAGLQTQVVYGDRALTIDHEDFAVLSESGQGLLRSFTLDGGLPVWRYEHERLALEKRLFMPHGQNAVCIAFRVIESDLPVSLECRPALHVRPIESAVATAGIELGPLHVDGNRAELGLAGLPPLRIVVSRESAIEAIDATGHGSVQLLEERARGYDCDAHLQTPCVLRLRFDADGAASIVAAVGEPASDAFGSPAALLADEQARRRAIVERAGSADDFDAALVLAADQFLIVPVGHDRNAPDPDQTLPPPGAANRTIIAGYHWFTDWGRDTMISLEGLTLELDRREEAAQILRLFSRHVQDGLIPNLFPEGARSGLYHTADATLWFVHAIGRYVARTGDRALVDDLLPVLDDIFAAHRHGTRFGIGVDPADGLLRQGADGYQLTWMDAKVDGWVVTPRRGKAVEINALWHNALCLMAGWLEAGGRSKDAAAYRNDADRVRRSFDERFWNPDTGWLYDVVDGEGGDDPACRPNQIFAIALPHPVLDRRHWDSVINAVTDRLLTPFGLRSLDPAHPDYRSQYAGDLRARDASYHQGTVWAWLIGPYVDALLRAGRVDHEHRDALLGAFDAHLGAAGVGTISEIFDADMPHLPRGCIAQAWSVAEVLRAWRMLGAAQPVAPAESRTPVPASRSRSAHRRS